MTSNAPLLAPTLNLEGRVSGYVASQQEGDQVMQFIVEREEGHPIAVVMRGKRLEGVIREGNRVGLVAPPNFDTLTDKTLHPLKLWNDTTQGYVSVSSPGFRRKAVLAGISTFKTAWKAFVGVCVAALFALPASLLGVHVSRDEGFTPNDFEAPSPSILELVVMELAWLVIAAVLSYLFIYRKWRWRGGAFPVSLPVVLAVAVAGGVAIAVFWSGGLTLEDLLDASPPELEGLPTGVLDSF
jgi:hypothetical protein